jgi:hypothetical protein
MGEFIWVPHWVSDCASSFVDGVCGADVAIGAWTCCYGNGVGVEIVSLETGFARRSRHRWSCNCLGLADSRARGVFGRCEGKNILLNEVNKSIFFFVPVTFGGLKYEKSRTMY